MESLKGINVSVTEEWNKFFEHPPMVKSNIALTDPTFRMAVTVVN